MFNITALKIIILLDIIDIGLLTYAFLNQYLAIFYIGLFLLVVGLIEFGFILYCSKK